MEDLQKLIGSMRPVYEIFLSENRDHLVFFEDHLRQFNNAGNTANLRDLLDSAVPAIENRFHLIKGGAGFLKLEDIARIAAQGSKLFGPESNLAPDDRLAAFSQLVGRLGEATSLLEKTLSAGAKQDK